MGKQMWVDNLCIYDPEWKNFGETMKRDAESKMQSSESRAVYKLADLEGIFDDYINVKNLEFAFHGSPGMIHLPDTTGITAAGLAGFCKNPMFLAKGARILFHSCQIAQGSLGKTFLENIGKGFLTGKGGIVGAANVDTALVMPWGLSYLMPFSGGDLTITQYDINGKISASKMVNRWGTMSDAP